MGFDIHHQIPQAFTRMMAGAQVMHIAKDPPDRVGARTAGRQKERGQAWVICQPLCNRFRLMDFVVISHGRDPLERGGGRGVVQGLQ